MRNDDEMAGLYDQQHEVWPAWSEGEGDAASVAAFLQAAYGGVGSALDLGCGVGREACALANRGWTVRGIDLSPRLIDMARSRAERLDVANARFDVFDLTGPPAHDQVDLVYSWDSVFAIWDQAGQTKLVSQWAAALRPGGLFVLGQLSRSVFSKNRDELIEMKGDWIGPGRTERRMHWDEAAEEYQDSVTWFSDTGEVRQLPTQRLKLLSNEALGEMLRSAGLLDVEVIGTDVWELQWPGLRPPSESSNQVIAIGRRPK